MNSTDLDRVAADLDHIRSLCPLATGRRDSLRLAAAELRALAALRAARPVLIARLAAVEEQAGALLAVLAQEPRA